MATSFPVHQELAYVDVAELDMVVVQTTAWYQLAIEGLHDVAWKNLGDSGFPDRSPGWGRRDETDDLDRVGIHGGSAGGHAMRALLAMESSTMWRSGLRLSRQPNGQDLVERT